MQDDTTPDPAMDTGQEQRQTHMAALWAAELLGLIGQAAHDYARDLVHAARQNPGGDHVLHRLTRDLRGKVGPHEIREKLTHFLHEARHGGPGGTGSPPSA